tara:strand:+ start:10744 stop:11244 length:501 start_codon:yes stop_codon:yes gene_type:complete
MENIEFDSEWIKDYEEKENEYKKFYKEEVNIIDIIFIYINDDNEIYNVKNFKEYIANSQINYERIIEIIKNYQNNMDIKHKLIGIMNYKIDIDTENIKQLFNYNINPGTLYSIKNINNINFDKTINLLQDINSVIFIFKVKNIDKNTTTRRITLTEKQKKTKRKYT